MQQYYIIMFASFKDQTVVWALTVIVKYVFLSRLYSRSQDHARLACYV